MTARGGHGYPLVAMLALLSVARRGIAALIVALPAIAFFARGVLAEPGPVPAGRGVIDTTVGSLALGLCAAAGATLLGLPVALVLGRRSGSGLLAAACLAPLVVPSYVLAIGWYPVLGTHGLLAWAWNPAPLYTPVGAGIVQAFQLWPLPALLGAAALSRADAALDEAARLLAGRGMTVRLAAPGLGAGFAIALVLSVGDFGVSGCFNLATVSEEVYARYSTLFDHRAAALAAVPLLVALPPLLLLASRAAGRMRASGRRPWGSPSRLDRLALAALLCIALGIPGLYLARTGGAHVPEVMKLHKAEILATLQYAGLGTALAGALAALGSGRRFRHVVETGFVVAFALPGVVTGMGILALDRAARGELRETLGTGALVVLAIAVRVAWLPWKAVDLTIVEGPDPASEAAAVHGVPRWRRWWGIAVPRTTPAFAAGLAAAFVLAAGEIGAVVLLCRDENTIALRIFSLIHYGYTANVAALCLAMVGLLLLALPIAVTACDAWRRR